MTDLRKAAQQVLHAWDSPAGMKDLCVAMDTFRAALEQQVEPVGEVDAIGLNGTDFHVSFTRPMTIGTKLYTTPPQRQWVGLTDEDVNRESAPITSQMKLAFHAGMYVAQKILKEKNGLHKD
jgi:hypothetical protein